MGLLQEIRLFQEDRKGVRGREGEGGGKGKGETCRRNETPLGVFSNVSSYLCDVNFFFFSLINAFFSFSLPSCGNSLLFYLIIFFNSNSQALLKLHKPTSVHASTLYFPNLLSFLSFFVLFRASPTGKATQERQHRKGNTGKPTQERQHRKGNTHGARLTMIYVTHSTKAPVRKVPQQHKVTYFLATTTS